MALADLLTDRNEHMEHSMELNRRRIGLLNNYSQDGEQELTEYASIFIAPLREKIQQKAMSLAKESVEIDKIMAMVPMLIMAVTQSVNIPLLLAAAGIEPDEIALFVGGLSDFLKQGVQDEL